MKTLLSVCAVTLVLALLALTGCATRHKIDWSARVGNYTFDQAVLELGPPAKQATLSDGTLVAEWQTATGYTQTDYVPYAGAYRYPYYGSYVAPLTTYSPGTFLRLTFGPDSQLKVWKKFMQ